MAFPEKGWHLAYKEEDGEDVNAGPVHIGVLAEKFQEGLLRPINYVYHSKYNGAQWARMNDVEGLEEALASFELLEDAAIPPAPQAPPMFTTVSAQGPEMDTAYEAEEEKGVQPQMQEYSPEPQKEEEEDSPQTPVSRSGRLPTEDESITTPPVRDQPPKRNSIPRGGIVKEGYMEVYVNKLIGNNWQKRYAILTPASFIVFTSSEAQQSDEAPIAAVVLRRSHISNVLPARFRRSKESFTLLPSDPTAKALYLNCESKSGYDDWYKAITRVIVDFDSPDDENSMKTFTFANSTAKAKQSRAVAPESISRAPECADEGEDEEQTSGLDEDGNLCLDWRNLIFKGYINKLGGGKLRKVWQERFFILCGSHLVWATDELTLMRDQFINGHADVTQCLVERSAKFGNSHANVFSVFWKSKLVNEKVYYMECSSGEQLGVWMNCIENWESEVEKRLEAAAASEATTTEAKRHHRGRTMAIGDLDELDEYKEPPPAVFLVIEEGNTKELLNKQKAEVAKVTHSLLNNKPGRVWGAGRGSLNTSHFERTLAHMGRGVYGLHRIGRLIENTAMPQLQFAHSLDKTLSVQTEKLKRNKEKGKVEETPEFMNAYAQLHLLFQTQHQALQHQYEQMGPLVSGLDMLGKLIEQETPPLFQRVKKLAADMRREGSYVSARERKARKHFTDYKSDLQGTGAKSLKAKFKSTKSLREKAGSSSTQYVEAIDAGNEHYAQYRDDDLPAVYCELEALERTRLGKIKDALANFASLQRDNLNKQLASLEKFESAIQDMDDTKILGNFVRTSTIALGDEDVFGEFRYELSCRPDDILYDEAAVKRDTKFSVFGTSLEKIMLRQKQECKEELQVPMVMHKLVEAVRENDGCSTEGIFRISASKYDLDACTRKVDSWDYVLAKASPHLYAAALKSWLRMLEDSLVPSEALYDRALSLARNPNSTEKTYLDFVNLNLEPTNKECLQQIAELVRDIVVHSEVNRMSVDNLAIVFAPSVLRNPTDDPESMMKNSGAEVKFVRQLLLALAPPGSQ